MADQGSWFKLWIGADEDPDLAGLSLEDFARWCICGLYLKKHGNRGIVVIKKPAHALQRKMRVGSYDELLTVLNSFPNCVVEERQNPSVTGVTVLRVTWRNWSKYQGDVSRERVRRHRANVTLQREEKRGEENRRENKPSSAAVKITASAKEFPPDDLWILNFLETQTSVNLPQAHLKTLQNPDFWERTSEACGGIDLALLQAEFAKMGNWIADNPKRVPTARGMRRFVAGWLERTYEKERRYGSQGARR